jgi:hypothetical protein
VLSVRDPLASADHVSPDEGIKVNKSEKETDFATSIQGFRRQKIDDRPKPALSQPKKVTEQSAFFWTLNQV